MHPTHQDVACRAGALNHSTTCARQGAVPLEGVTPLSSHRKSEQRALSFPLHR